MILVTQFREEVKYCRDEKKQQCFAKRLKEDCGESASELRQSIAGPACTNQKGKAIGNVFLITTSDSDNCAIVGVKKVKIQEGADVVKDKVLAHLEIAIPGLEADRASDADKLVNATSCSAFGSTPLSFWVKFIAVIVQLGELIVKPAWKSWKMFGNGMSFMANVFFIPIGMVYISLSMGVMLHPFWIFIPHPLITSMCDRYKIVCGYELGLAILKSILTFRGLLTYCSTWQGEDSKTLGYFAIGNVVISGVAIISDICGLIDVNSAAAEKCYDFPQQLQIATIVLNIFSFLVKCNEIRMKLISGVSGTEPKSDNKVESANLVYYKKKMPGQDGAADAPKEGDAHSKGSAFSDHENQDGNAQDDARKADEDKDTQYSKGGQPIARV